MPLQKIVFRPGIIKELTNYTNEGGWFDCDKVRFRSGAPEKIGGWQVHEAQYSATFAGVCRCLHAWVTLDGDNLQAVGTHLKFYIELAGTYNDITPIRRTASPLINNPLATTNGSSTVTVTDAGHGAIVGDYVTLSGATTFNNIDAADINQEHVITAVTTNTWTFTAATNANATSSGGGVAVDAEYQINIGNQSDSSSPGWGAGTWGSGPWGGPAPVSVSGPRLRIWFADNFGEDLLFNIMDGAIYYWDATSGVSVRGVELDTLPGASDVPTIARQVLVSEADRHVVALGATPLGSAVQDPLLIRWSDTEDAANWTPDTTNTAGDFRLSQGSSIVCGLRTRQELMIWTDVSLHSMQFLGPPYTFGVGLVADKTTIAGPKAAVAMGDVVYWMGLGEFYRYDGRVQSMDCTVKDYIFSNINMSQLYKVYAGSNQAFNELWWFYPAGDSEEPDSYVVHNIELNAWYIGTLARTAWLDRGIDQYPSAAATDGYLYDHEFGSDDGSTNPPTAIEAYIQSSDFDIGDGDHVMFVRRILPDITFRNSSATQPQVTFTLYPRYNPGAAQGTGKSKVVTRTQASPEVYTDQLYIRMRSRQVALRVESTDIGVEWRLGATRLDMKPDGQRE